MTPTGFFLLQEDEGTRLFVYDDATGQPIVAGTYVQGNPTIGTGRNLSAEGITKEEAWSMFQFDVSKREKMLSEFSWYNTASPVRQDVLVNMAFNMGVNRLLGFHAMLFALGHQNYVQAAAEIRNSLAYRQLPTRYEALAKAMETDTWAT